MPSENNYRKICEKLEEILKKTVPARWVYSKIRQMMEKKKPDSDIIDYFTKLLDDYNLHPDLSKVESKKSQDMSSTIRLMTNALFTHPKIPPLHIEVLCRYNESLCYAVHPENISIALANRSAVLYAMEMYHECIKCIQLAREHDVPEHLREKLRRREELCMERLVDKEIYVPTIGMPVNEKIPFLAKCLALREDEIFGRHIITEEDIPAGTFIAIKEPFCKVVADADKYLRCATCLAEVPHLLLPCDTCTQAMFCSKVCKKKAMEGFHGIECSISRALFEIFDDYLVLTFRMVVCTFLAFANTEEMPLALEKIEMEKKNVFSFDWNEELSPEDIYAPIHNLARNEYNLDREDYLTKMSEKYIIASLMFGLLARGCPAFKERYLNTKAAEDLLKKVIFRHILACPVNALKFDSILDFENSRESVGCEDIVEIYPKYATAICGFYGLINHSCTPNIVPIFLESGYGLITIKNIAAGEQIFHNYNCHHENTMRSDRQKLLLRKYDFHCKCVACNKNYPMARILPTPRDIPPLKLHDYRTVPYGLWKFNFMANKKGFDDAVRYIRKYSHRYPILQLFHAEEELRLCLDIICNNIPLRVREQTRLK